MVVSYLFITSSFTDHPPPQEDIDLQPNPVYGVAGSGMCYSLAGMVSGEGHRYPLIIISLTDHPPPQEDIDLQPNPVYGVAGSGMYVQLSSRYEGHGSGPKISIF